MALKFMDGFESEHNYEAIGQINYSNHSYSLYLGATSEQKFNGSYSFKLGQGSQQDYGRYTRIGKVFTGDSSVMVVGFAVRFYLNQDEVFFNIDNVDGSRIIKFKRVNSTQKIEVYNGATLIATTTNTFANNTQYYLQIKVIADAVNGKVVLLIGNQQELNISGLNTSATNNTFNRLYFSTDCNVWVNNCFIYLDDIYVLDQEPPLNDFLGVCSVIGIRPSLNGSKVDFTFTGAASAQDCIDEISASTSEYIYGDAVDETALFDYSDINVIGTIKGIMIYDYAARSDIGSGLSKYKVILKNSLDQLYTSSEQTLFSSAQAAHQQLFENNPITDSTWDATDINNLEIGFKITYNG